MDGHPKNDKLDSAWTKLVKLSFKVISDDGHTDKYIDEMDSLREQIAKESGHLDVFCFDSYQLTDAANYLAKLYLYGHGDSRSSDVFKLLHIEDKDGHVLASGAIEIPALLTPRDDEAISEGRAFEMIEVGTMGNVYAIATKALAIEGRNRDEIEALAVSRLCMEAFRVAILQPAYLLSVKDNPPKWDIERYRPFGHRVVEEIIAGNVAACANCGRPVYVGRLNASPFCKRPHYNRYADKAKCLVKKGRSAYDIHEAFPAIDLLTIQDWVYDYEQENDGRD